MRSSNRRPTRRLAAVMATTAALLVAATGTAPAAAPPDRYAHNPLRARPDVTRAPQGLSPATVKSVYGFPTSPTAGAGQTISIVDAFDDPNAEADLGTFSAQYGLPACTTANGCFTKVDQNGGTSYPRADSGWALEISLDVQWAHAIAPGARTRMTEKTFGDLPEVTEGFDPLAPENIAPLVAFLASDQAAGITGQVFGIQGGLVELYQGWTPVSSLSRDDRWTPEDIAARADELFGDRPRVYHPPASPFRQAAGLTSGGA